MFWSQFPTEYDGYFGVRRHPDDKVDEHIFFSFRYLFHIITFFICNRKRWLAFYDFLFYFFFCNRHLPNDFCCCLYSFYCPLSTSVLVALPVTQTKEKQFVEIICFQFQFLYVLVIFYKRVIVTRGNAKQNCVIQLKINFSFKLSGNEFCIYI